MNLPGFGGGSIQIHRPRSAAPRAVTSIKNGLRKSLIPKSAPRSLREPAGSAWNAEGTFPLHGRILRAVGGAWEFFN